MLQPAGGAGPSPPATDFAARRQRDSLDQWLRNRGVGALPGADVPRIANQFLAAGYRRGVDFNRACKNASKAVFFSLCSAVHVSDAVAQQLYDTRAARPPSAPPAGGVLKTKAIRRPTNRRFTFTVTALVPQPDAPRVVELGPGIFVGRNMLREDWWRIATAGIEGKQLNVLKNQRGGGRLNSDPFHNADAITLFAGACKEMTGNRLCSIAQYTVLQTQRDTTQQDEHIDSDKKSYYSMIAPFGLNARALVFGPSVAGGVSRTITVNVGDILLFRVDLCHAGGAWRSTCLCPPGDGGCGSAKANLSILCDCNEVAVHAFVATTAEIFATIGAASLGCAAKGTLRI